MNNEKVDITCRHQKLSACKHTNMIADKTYLALTPYEFALSYSLSRTLTQT